MPTDPQESSQANTTTALLQKVRAGDESALNSLFGRYLPSLRRWAHGRLPLWARGIADTADIVQDVLLQTFRRLEGFEVRRKGALQAYLRQSIQNRIRDEFRSLAHRPNHQGLETGVIPDPGPSPLQSAVDAQTQRRYSEALKLLRGADQELIVGSVELGYSYEQLALATGRATAESARIAVRRALAKLAEKMADD